MIAATGSSNDTEHLKKIVELLKKSTDQADLEMEEKKKLDEEIRKKEIEEAIRARDAAAGAGLRSSGLNTPAGCTDSTKEAL